VPKPPRSQRRGQPRPQTRRQVPIVPAAAPAPAAATVPAPSRQPDAARERSISRFTARDYTYVRREIARVLIFAAAIFVIIIVASFFLP
jgi:hypothetical protein